MRLSWSSSSSGLILDRSASSFRLAPFDTASSINARAYPAATVGSGIVPTALQPAVMFLMRAAMCLGFVTGYAKPEIHQKPGSR